ncbi:MAG: hypothetical protein ACYTDU_18325 [Planctomycetota bacterium]
MSESPAFNVFWQDVRSLRPATTTGRTPLPAVRPARPLLVYVYDGADVDARYAVEKHKAFADEGVLVGARFFSCVRIEAGRARADVALKQHVAKIPCLLAVRSNGEVLRSLRKLSAAKVVSAMRAVLRKDYTNRLGLAIREQRDCFKQKAELVRERGRLERLDEKKRAVAEQALKKKEQALAAREAALYELRRKQTK